MLRRKKENELVYFYMYHLYFHICKIKFVIVLNFLVLQSGGGWRGISVSLIFSYAYIKYRDIYK